MTIAYTVFERSPRILFDRSQEHKQGGEQTRGGSVVRSGLTRNTPLPVCQESSQGHCFRILP